MRPGQNITYKVNASNEQLQSALEQALPGAVAQTKQIAPQFKGASDSDTCRKIFDFLKTKITYDKDGKFESMQASGSARMTSSLPSAREDAFIVAKMRAQQKLVEFMKNELESEHFKKTVYDSLQEGQNTGGQDNNEINSKITRNLTEEIRTKQRAILKGVHIESKKFDTSTNTVLVVVKTGTKEIATAKTVYTMMGN